MKKLLLLFLIPLLACSREAEVFTEVEQKTIEEMAIIPTTGVAFARVVAATLGAPVTYDDGALCTHPNINKWSKWKPVRFNKVTELTLDDLKSVNYGLVPPSPTTNYANIVNTKWGYDKPTGGQLSPFRIGDFRNYNHEASAICDVEKTITVNRSMVSSRDISMLINISGSDDLIGLDDFAGVIGNMYYGVLLTDGSNVYVKTAQSTLSGGGNSVALDFTQPPLNEDKSIPLYHLLMNKAVTELTQIGAAGTILFNPVPTADFVENISTLTVKSGLGVDVVIVGIGGQAPPPSILQNIDMYLVPDAPSFPTTGGVYLRLRLRNTGNEQVVIPSGAWAIQANPTYYGANTNRFTAAAYSTAGASLSTIIVPANSELDIVVGANNVMDRNGTLIQTPTSGTKAYSNIYIYYNGTRIASVSLNFIA